MLQILSLIFFLMNWDAAVQSNVFPKTPVSLSLYFIPISVFTEDTMALRISK